MPRPGGGAIRRIGLRIGKGMVRGAARKPYYASADPRRLGSRNATSSGAGEQWHGKEKQKKSGRTN